MKFIQGTTYYSHANPAEELERNFHKMSRMGINATRVAEIWPGWSVIEKEPGKYNFEILDDYLEKARKNKIQVVMGVGIIDPPFWLFAKYNDLRVLEYDGTPSSRRVQSSCIDHPEYRRHMKKFIINFTRHYNQQEGIIAWQFANEMRYNVDYCDTPATRERFRDWLKNHYNNDLEILNKEWGVHYLDFSEIYPYKSADGPPTGGIAQHCLKTLEFQNWSLEELISWGVKIMKQYTDLPIYYNCPSHSGIHGSHWNLSEPCDIVAIDIYGTTYENPGIYTGFLLDTGSSIARQQDKPLWITETSAGQYGTYQRTYIKQKLIENTIIEMIGAGASGVFYYRHKPPVWEQPHKYTGSQTFLRVDETELEYVKTPKNIAKFMNNYEERILSAQPVQPDIAIYFPVESISLGREIGYYKDARDSVFGARAIWAGLQYPVEILDTEAICKMDLNKYKLIYLPVSYLLPQVVGDKLKEFVKKGGILISEGRPGYVDKNAKLYQKQPGAGLEEVFGAREDIFYNIEQFKANIDIDNYNQEVILPFLKQTYRLEGGKPFIKTKENEICGVRNKYGDGVAYLIGGAPSLYFRIGAGKYDKEKISNSLETEKQQKVFFDFFQHIVNDYNIKKPVPLSGGSPGLTVRYLEREDEILIFTVNYNQKRKVIVKIEEAINKVYLLDIEGEKLVDGQGITISPLSWAVFCLKNVV